MEFNECASQARTCITERKPGWQEIRELLSATESAKKVYDSVKHPGLLQITMDFAARKTIEQLDTLTAENSPEVNLFVANVSWNVRRVNVPTSEKQRLRGAHKHKERVIVREVLSTFGYSEHDQDVSFNFFFMPRRFVRNE